MDRKSPMENLIFQIFYGFKHNITNAKFEVIGFNYVPKGKKSSANSCFDIVCDLVELPFRITSASRKLKRILKIPTISKRPNVAKRPTFL
jgi:hypothetical protein